MAKTWSSNIINGGEETSESIVPLKMQDLSLHIKSATKRDVGAPHPPDMAEPQLTMRTSELDSMREEAFQSGYGKGREEGEEAVRLQLESVLMRFQESLHALDLFRTQLFKESEGEIVDLILAAAGKIVHTEIRSDKKLVASVIKNALHHLSDRTDIVVRIHPDDLKLIEENREALFGKLDEMKHISFQEDETIGAGGCLVESRFGEIDARIDKQLERLEEGIKSVLG